MNKASLFFILLGLTLVILACSTEADKIIDEPDHDLTKPHEDRELSRLSRRAVDDDEDGGSKRKKGRKKKSGAASTTTTSAPDGSTTTDSPTTTTGSPNASTSGKPKTTKKSSSKEDLDSAADDEFYKELLKDRDDEEVLISKAAAAIKSWSGWLEAHDKKTLNRNRAQRFLNMINSQLVNKYHVGSPVGVVSKPYQFRPFHQGHVVPKSLSDFESI